MSIWPRLTSALHGSCYLYRLWGWLPLLTAHQRVHSHKGWLICYQKSDLALTTIHFPPRSGSLLFHLMTPAFPAHFTWDSHATKGDRDTSAVTLLSISNAIFDRVSQHPEKEEQMPLYPCKQMLRWHSSKALGSKGHTKDKCIAWWAFKKSVWVQISWKAHLTLIFFLKWQFDLSSG